MFLARSRNEPVIAADLSWLNPFGRPPPKRGQQEPANERGRKRQRAAALKTLREALLRWNVRLLLEAAVLWRLVHA